MLSLSLKTVYSWNRSTESRNDLSTDQERQLSQRNIQLAGAVFPITQQTQLLDVRADECNLCFL
jgi:hypothetical protein